MPPILGPNPPTAPQHLSLSVEKQNTEHSLKCNDDNHEQRAVRLAASPGSACVLTGLPARLAHEASQASVLQVP